MSLTSPPRVPRGLELLVYVLLAVGAVWPALGDRRLVSGDGIDLYGTLWFYWWIQDCLRHLHGPGFTDLFFYPLGKDIFAHTGNNFIDALVSVPFQWVLGFPWYQPVFVAFLMVGNALGFRPLARRVVDGDASGPLHRRVFGGPRLSWAAFLSVLLWSSCSFILFELTCGRLTQAMLWFLPLAIDGFLGLEAGEPRWRRIGQTGLFLALQAWTYWFMGYFIGLLLAWIGVMALLARWRDPRALLALARDQALSALLALLLVSPAMLVMYARAQGGEVPGLAAHETGLFDLPRSLGNNVAATLHGYWLMERWGAPMLGYATWILAILVALLFGRQRVRWLGGAALALLFGIGPSLPPIDDKPIRMFHYLFVYHTVPFLDRLWFPYRFVVIAFVCIALVSATGFGRVLAWLQVRFAARRPLLAGFLPAALLVVGLMGLNLVEQHARHEFPFVTRNVDPPRIFFWIRDKVREDGRMQAFIHLPIGVTQPSIIWQTLHEQPMFGGMGENAPLLWPEGYQDRLNLEFIRFLFRVTRTPEGVLPPRDDTSRQALLAEGFRWLVLHREVLDDSLNSNPDDDEALVLPFAVTRRLREVLGEPVAVDGGLVVWDLEGTQGPVPGFEPNETLLTTRTWNPSDRPAYEVVMRARGRMPSGGTPRRRQHNPGGDPNQRGTILP